MQLIHNPEKSQPSILLHSATQLQDPSNEDSTKCTTGARFTEYLMTIIRSRYDNAKVTIDLRWTSYLRNIKRRMQGFSWVQYDSFAKW